MALDPEESTVNVGPSREIMVAPGRIWATDSAMNDFTWHETFLSLFNRCVADYKAGRKDYSQWFSAEDLAFLKAIGCREREFFDFVEDSTTWGMISAAGALMIAEVRRDYFLHVQKGVVSTHIVSPETLPAKTAEVDGIAWLPRIIVKAKAKLRGEMHPDTMYGCGGDCQFLQKFDIHPAEFLRVVWSAGDDDAKVISFVKSKA